MPMHPANVTDTSAVVSRNENSVTNVALRDGVQRREPERKRGSCPLQRRVRRRLPLETDRHVSGVLFKPKVQSDLDCAPICFQRLVQKQLPLFESRGDDGAHDRGPLPSATEFRVCEDTWISSLIVPRAVPGHRRDSLPIEVCRHVIIRLMPLSAK